MVLKNTFRFAIFDSKTLSKRKQDNAAFNGKINCSKNVISFPSLSNDILLVVPCRKSQSVDYTSLSTFSRTASIMQQMSFWKKVGDIIKEGDWVSTSGLGVSWLHLRIAKKPKHYHQSFLTGFNNYNTNTKYNSSSSFMIEKYIEKFNFPSNFINMIVISKNWKSDMQLNLIIYYFELLPKNTVLVFGKNKILKEKACEVKLKTKDVDTDWNKHGRYGAIKRNEEILHKYNPHLITFFGGENNLITTVEKLIIT